MTSPDLSSSYAHCENLVREYDRDRWLASLFLPARVRPHILALYAFSYEIARVREMIREPGLGEIRLTWWRDVLEQGEGGQHPVAAALTATHARYHLSWTGFLNLIEARRFDLYDDPMPRLNDLEGYAGETASFLFQQAAVILNEGNDPRAADAAGHAGVAYAFTGLMRALPLHAARGQAYLPRDTLERHGITSTPLEAGPALQSALAEMRMYARNHFVQARAAIGLLDRHIRPAFAVLGLVPPYLAALEKRKNPLEGFASIADWRKPLALWFFMRRIMR